MEADIICEIDIRYKLKFVVKVHSDLSEDCSQFHTDVLAFSNYNYQAVEFSSFIMYPHKSSFQSRYLCSETPVAKHTQMVLYSVYL